jgi:ribosomal protein S18 acetylase RimI-like enzyme
MINTEIEILNKLEPILLEELSKLEIKNLGKNAAVNEWVLPVIVQYGKFIVARVSNGNIAGVCQLFRKWDDYNTAFIHSFYIDKNYRNRGIGKKLLSEVINISKKEKVFRIELTVSPENDIALKLYKYFGFKVLTLKKNEYGPGVDRYLMSLRL